MRNAKLQHRARTLRNQLIEAQGFRVLRFWDNQVFQETQAVLQEIMRALESPAPILTFPRKRRKGISARVATLLRLRGTREHLKRSRARVGAVRIERIDLPRTRKNGPSP